MFFLLFLFFPPFVKYVCSQYRVAVQSLQEFMQANGLFPVLVFYQLAD